MIKHTIFVLLTGISFVSVALAAPNYDQAGQNITHAVNESAQAQTEYRTGNVPNSPFSALNQVVSDGLKVGSNKFTWPSQHDHPNTNTTTVPNNTTPTTTSETLSEPAKQAATEPTANTPPPSHSSAGITGVPHSTNQNNDNSSPLNF